MLGALFVFGGCGDSDEADSSRATAEQGTRADMSRPAFDEARAMHVEGIVATPPRSGLTSTRPTEQPIGRKLIRNARMAVEVPSVVDALRALSRLAADMGGYVSEQEQSARGDGRARGAITLRVPTDSLDSARGSIHMLGRVRSERVWTSDVTDEYYDVEMRLGNARDEREKLLELLERADGVNHLLAVRRELSRVTTEIERMTGRMRRLTNQIDYSTISVELSEPVPLVERGGTAVGKVLSAFRDMIDIFWSTVAGIIRFIGFVTPVAMALLLGIALLAFWVRRRRERNRRKAEGGD